MSRTYENVLDQDDVNNLVHESPPQPEQMTYEGIPILNTCTFDGDPDYPGATLYLMNVGGYQAYVWTSRGSIEDAMESTIDWLEEEKHCDAFVSLDEDDFRQAAADIGETWQPDWPAPHYNSPTHAAWERVRDQAEIDLWVIGHAPLPKCTAYHQLHTPKMMGMLYVSDWDFAEGFDPHDYESIMRLSNLDCRDLPYLIGDIVRFTPVAEDDLRDAGIYQVAAFDRQSLDLDRLDGVREDVGERITWEPLDGGTVELLLPSEVPSLEPEPARPQTKTAHPTLREEEISIPVPTPVRPIQLTELEQQLVAWMLNQKWHETKQRAVEHVLRLRASGHPWLTRGGFSGLDDDQIAQVLWETLPRARKKLFGLPAPRWMR